MTSFAIFRQPRQLACTFVAQTEGSPLQLASPSDLAAQQGFVVAPFAATPSEPLLIIRPDRVLTFATADELTKMHAVVTMTEGEDRDSIVLTSAYDTNVILVGIRRDDSLPPEKVRIDATWDQFAANL
jgi:hypothetical protein